MKIKIIIIVHYSPYLSVGCTEKIKLTAGKLTAFNDTPQFWFFILGKQLMDIYSDEFNVEIWQPDINIKKVLKKEYNNGLVYYLFPAKLVNELTLTGIKKRLFSKELVNSIKSEYTKGNNLILHFRGTQEYMTRYIINKYYDKIPLLGQFTINVTQRFKEIKKIKNPLKYLYFQYNQIILYKRLLNKIKNIAPGTQNDLRNNEFFKNLNIFYRGNFNNFGYDINIWKPNNTNVDKTKLKYKIKSNEKVILLSSRLVKEKQVKEIIEILMNIKNPFCCIITGSTNSAYAKELKDLSHKIIHNRVIFTEFVDDSELIELYNIADLFISYSKQEAGPGSVIQTYLMGVPVIQSSVGIANEIAQKYKISRVVDPENKEELKEAIEDFFNGNIPKILDRKVVESLFSWENIIKYYHNIYIDLTHV